MTLIEVMAVVFIIGLTGTLVLLTVPNRQLPERTMVQTLQSELQRAREEAVLVGAPRGLDVREDGTLIIYVYRRAEWQQARSLPPASDDLEIFIREDPAAAARRTDADTNRSEGRPAPPRFIAEAIGVSSAMELEIVGEQERFFFSIQEDGVIDVSEG